MRHFALIDGSDGSYGVVFPDFSGCVAMGVTVDEAMILASEALGDWISTVEVSGNAVPAARTLEEFRVDPDVGEALREGSVLTALSVVRSTVEPIHAALRQPANAPHAIG